MYITYIYDELSVIKLKKVIEVLTNNAGHNILAIYCV